MKRLGSNYSIEHRVGHLFAEVVQLRKMSVREISRKAGLSKTTAHKILQADGRTSFSLDTLCRMAEALDLELCVEVKSRD